MVVCIPLIKWNGQKNVTFNCYLLLIPLTLNKKFTFILLSLCSILIFDLKAQHTVSITNIELEEETFKISYQLTEMKTEEDEFTIHLYYITENDESFLVKNAIGDIGEHIGVLGEHTVYWNPQEELEKYRGNMRLKLEAEVSYTPVSITSTSIKGSYKKKKPKSIQVDFKDGVLTEGGAPKQVQMINAETGSVVNTNTVEADDLYAVIKTPTSKGSYYVRMVDSKGNYTNKSETFKVKKGGKLWIPILLAGGAVALIVEMGSVSEPPSVPSVAGQ